MSSHYVVVAERLLHVYALLPLRLQTGTKPKWQMGRKGEAVTQGRASVNMLSGMRGAHWVTGRCRRAQVPPPQLPENACHVHYCTMRPFWLEHAVEKKRDLRFITQRFTKHASNTRPNSRFLTTIQTAFKSSEHSQETRTQVSRVTKNLCFRELVTSRRFLPEPRSLKISWEHATTHCEIKHAFWPSWSASRSSVLKIFGDGVHLYTC